MEEEARDILRSALATVDAQPGNLVASVRRKVEKVGGIDSELPPRALVGEPIVFAE